MRLKPEYTIFRITPEQDENTVVETLRADSAEEAIDAFNGSEAGVLLREEPDHLYFVARKDAVRPATLTDGGEIVSHCHKLFKFERPDPEPFLVEVTW